MNDIAPVTADDAARSPLERALDAFAFGRGSPADIDTIAREARTEFVQIHVRLRNPPKPDQRVHLGRYKSGPLSVEGRPVTHVSGPRWGGLYAAWWRVRDLCPEREARPRAKRSIRRAASAELAEELTRRGWTCTPPD